MAKLLFKLKGVPDSEADEVRQLLDQHNIEFYETPPSIWQVSMEAIWLRDDEQLEQAKQLLAEYQQQLSTRVKEEYAELEKQGQAPNLWSRFKENPMQFIVFAMIIALVLYLSITPFTSLGSNN